VLCYGSETWTLSQRAETMVNAFERKILRIIYGPLEKNEQWRIRYNHEIYQLFAEADLATTTRLQRLKWAGHLQRMEESRVVKRIFNQKLEGKRPVRRPRARWADKIQGDARSILETPNWRKAAEDRNGWRKKIEEACARFGL